MIETILNEKPKIPIETKLFAEDLYNLLIRKKLRNFEGLAAFRKDEVITGCLETVFFHSATARYRGDFIGFVPALNNLEEGQIITGEIFFQRKKSFFSLNKGDNKNRSEIVKQTKKSFGFIQKLYFEVSYLIKEIKGLLSLA